MSIVSLAAWTNSARALAWGFTIPFPFFNWDSKNSQQLLTMDQRQDQQQQQQGGTQGNPGPPPIAPNPHAMPVTMNGQPGVINQGQNMNSHLMGLMTNPALAAAAAASPLFPPAAMLTNPGAFFAVPEMFQSSNGAVNPQTTQAVQAAAAAQGGVALAQVQTQQNGNSPAALYPTTLGTSQQMQATMQQIQPQMQHIPGGQPSMVAYGGVQMQQGNQPHMAIAAASAQAIPDDIMNESFDGQEKKSGKRKKDLSPTERAKQNRDRNREHARSTRLRKKAYIQKLKELVEGLHSERTEEVRQRRVAIQHLAEMQNVRRAVIHSFLRFHSNYEKDKRKWSTILEDEFWLKQPVTPYRCFRRSEIENVRLRRSETISHHHSCLT